VFVGYLCPPEKMKRQFNTTRSLAFALLAFANILPFYGLAQETSAPIDSTKKDRFNLHFQATYVYQYKPAFGADYSGPNSLKTGEERDNSVTATLFLGIRLWQGAELYINPEIAGGSGLSGAYGMAASTNGETFRVGDPSPTLYLARGYIKQTIALNSKDCPVDDGANQLACDYRSHALSFYLGKFSLGDLFDNSAYATGPKTSFLNWCFMNNGAWDYAANLRGYTLSFVTALQWDNMTYKVALATMPTVANGPDLNTNLGQEYSINAEVSRTFKLHKKDGHLRLLGYYNIGDMGNYQTAINEVTAGNVPDVISTRKYGRGKYGFGLNFDQQLSNTIGVFGRAGWNDGQNETWCFTEADETISAGLSINGTGWKRKDDNIGVAIVVNGLSKEHRQYLADGGLGFQLGDGTLSYANETVAECYYSFKPVATGIWLSLDYQFALNPGYNMDRGPVNVFSFRAHVEL
jgi:high affinity Mn2+ porin